MMWRIFKFTALMAAFSTTNLAAQALSCMAPTPETSYQNYDAKPDYYQIFEGRLTPLEPVPQISSYTETPEPKTVRFQFTGVILSASNRSKPRPQSFEVRVTPGCAGPWCAGYPDGSSQIYFIGLPTSEYGSTHSYEPSACPGSAFVATHDTRVRLQRCLSGQCRAPAPEVVPEPRPELPEPPQREDQCGAGLVHGFVGEPVRVLPPLFMNNRYVRIIRPGDAVTKDYRLDRLNINLDGQDRIRTVQCG